MHVKGYAAPEAKAAIEQARLFIARAEELGEPAEDPLLLFSVLYGFWAAHAVAFNGNICLDLAREFLLLATKQGSAASLTVGHCIMGHSLLLTGDPAHAKAEYDKAVGLYNPSEHRVLAMRFGQDVRVAVLSFRSWALWFLGYPEAAMSDAEIAVSEARNVEHAATLMFALATTLPAHLSAGKFSAAKAANNELLALTEQRGADYWRSVALVLQGLVSALTEQSAHAIKMIISGLNTFRSTGATLYVPFWLSALARLCAHAGQMHDAWRYVDEAITAIECSGQRWCEAEVYRTAGELALAGPAADVTKAEAYFQRALGVARHQQAKSWELRAAMSLARLWRDQGKPQQAREVLAPVYGWFTEGFDTRDLLEAKALLEELAA
jgi:predicted ATPase